MQEDLECALLRPPTRVRAGGGGVGAPPNASTPGEAQPMASVPWARMKSAWAGSSVTSRPRLSSSTIAPLSPHLHQHALSCFKSEFVRGTPISVLACPMIHRPMRTWVIKSSLFRMQMKAGGAHVKCRTFEPSSSQKGPLLCSRCWCVTYRRMAPSGSFSLGTRVSLCKGNMSGCRAVPDALTSPDVTAPANHAGSKPIP